MEEEDDDDDDNDDDDDDDINRFDGADPSTHEMDADDNEEDDEEDTDALNDEIDEQLREFHATQKAAKKTKFDSDYDTKLLDDSEGKSKKGVITAIDSCLNIYQLSDQRQCRIYGQIALPFFCLIVVSHRLFFFILFVFQQGKMRLKKKKKNYWTLRRSFRRIVVFVMKLSLVKMASLFGLNWKVTDKEYTLKL
jgi:hypothetical protein